MKRVSELYNRHPGSDIYIVGTGTSLRVFPLDMLKGRITIGLNMAWKKVDVLYCITIHPELNIPEFMPNESPHPEIEWIIKPEKLQNVEESKRHLVADRSYFFESFARPNTQPSDQPSDSGREAAWVEKPHGDSLYQWSSISQTAVNLAANMGAKNIFLIGCDNSPLLDNHHAHDQHTRWKGVDPNLRYDQYYEGLAEIRPFLRKRGINLVSINPFLSLNLPERDYQRLCVELDQPKHIASHDVSERVSFKGRIKNVLQKANRVIFSK